MACLYSVFVIVWVFLLNFLLIKISRSDVIQKKKKKKILADTSKCGEVFFEILVLNAKLNADSCLRLSLCKDTLYVEKEMWDHGCI